MGRPGGVITLTTRKENHETNPLGPALHVRLHDTIPCDVSIEAGFDEAVAAAGVY